MDGQNRSYQPGADLPRPHYEAVDSTQPTDNEVNVPQTAEIASKTAEQPLTSPPPMPPPALADDSSTQAIPPQVPTLDTTNVTHIPVMSDSPAQAQDSDLIEQEWVNKAKAIVDNTKNDPYMQNKEISKVKADYIKKRYNKEIKVNSD